MVFFALVVFLFSSEIATQSSYDCDSIKLVVDGEGSVEKMEKVLVNLMNSEDVKDILRRQGHGSVFNYEYFSKFFQEDVNYFSIEADSAKLLFITDREDKSLVDPFNIVSIGIGYSREYFIVDNETKSHYFAHADGMGRYVKCD